MWCTKILNLKPKTQNSQSISFVCSLFIELETHRPLISLVNHVVRIEARLKPPDSPQTQRIEPHSKI